MSPITSHVLDTTSGKPASGLAVKLEISDGPDRWAEVGKAVTDAIRPDFGVRAAGCEPRAQDLPAAIRHGGVFCGDVRGARFIPKFQSWWRSTIRRSTITFRFC